MGNKSRIIKYRKWKDYFNVNLMECKLSLAFTLIVIVGFFLLHVYRDFSYFNTALQNMTLSIAVAFIGLMGIILAGIAIIASVLNKNVVMKIDQINGKGTTERLLTSFEFLGLNIAIQVVMFFIIYIILNSPYQLIDFYIFYILISIVCYLFLFTIFYTVALIGNCISIFFIGNLYESINETERNFYDLANEIRIDYLIEKVSKSQSEEEMTKELLAFTDRFDIEEKEELKKHFKDYYTN